ncbi:MULTISPECIES: sensor histidine kinase [Kordiimonas]|jgi:hypothetical protein|uniref:sensor histidine kinase n=1 Tax=Kordiimonas TaxID=288021 RepID=UPI00257A7D58|nr:ATP-binding protein [Kordiimonas sp. UBA4487]
MADKLEFQPKARMLLQLGDQLIRSESIALLELVKNAYDANANSATVRMQNLDKPELAEITISDDGDGMNTNIIRNVWMRPGSEYKDALIRSGEIDESKRVPIGGKGIGRFGVHKLGSVIELTSKKEGFPEVFIKIDWRDFLQDKLLSEIKIHFEERDTPHEFLEGKTGTKIHIRELKNTWTRGAVRDIYRAVNSLNSPFGSQDTFRTKFKLGANQSWLTGLTSFKDIEAHALYRAKLIIEGDKIVSLDYKFCPWDTMTKLQPVPRPDKNIDMVETVKDEHSGKKKLIPLDLSTHKIGRIELELLIFDRSQKILSLGVSDKKGFKEYLDRNGGIRVFRNGIRVYDYGEPGNDWLNLDMMRVNQPGKTISNNIIVGAVSLDRIASADLEEKTNREGFIENEAYRKFVSAIRFGLDKVLTKRNLDKGQVRKFYSPSGTKQPVIGQIRTLHDQVVSNVQDVKLRDELLKSIGKIEKDYLTISEVYTRSSSAGLSLSIVMHEIIHMISELAAAIKSKPVDAHVKQLVGTLQKTVGDYAGVIKQSKKSKVNLAQVTRQALSNIQFRIKAHEVDLLEPYLDRHSVNSNVSCAQNLVISTIINIVDNSIWWQTYAKTKNKKVLLDIVEYPEKHTSLLIADNGPGFTIPPEEAIRPFISDKSGGMGLGLHLADEVMKGQNGHLMFPDPYDFDLPDEFQSGAILLLAFRNSI